jgi:hypothetical protein
VGDATAIRWKDANHSRATREFGASPCVSHKKRNQHHCIELLIQRTAREASRTGRTESVRHRQDRKEAGTAPPSPSLAATPIHIKRLRDLTTTWRRSSSFHSRVGQASRLANTGQHTTSQRRQVSGCTHIVSRLQEPGGCAESLCLVAEQSFSAVLGHQVRG